MQQRGVDVRRQTAWQGARQAGNIGGEHQAAFGPLRPSPQGDVVEQVAQREHAGVHDAGRHLLVTSESAPPSSRAVPHQELLDLGALEQAQRADLGVMFGEELAERQEGVDETFDRRSGQDRGAGVDVGDHHTPDLRRRDRVEALSDAG